MPADALQTNASDNLSHNDDAKTQEKVENANVEAHANTAAAPAAPALSSEGLSDREVAARKEAGLSNVSADIKTKSIPEIIAHHSMTLFNAINLFLACLVITTGQYRNILFMVIVGLNLGIGVVQEIRAKLLVDKLTILTSKNVRVRRSGKVREIPLADIVQDDVILLARGEQAPCDGCVIEGVCAMDESLLTGESNPIEKQAGSEIFSGSFVDSGSIVYRATAVGTKSYVAKISTEAKYLKPIHSEIVSTINTIITLSSCILIPLGILLFVRIYVISHEGYSPAILQAVAATVGMIPQGLVLLTSTVFAIATTKLARQHVLVQQSYCVETLARVDVVCLDKTGTITTGKMEIESILSFVDGKREDAGMARVRSALSYIVKSSEDSANETAHACLKEVEHEEFTPDLVQQVIPFSSRTKYSGCVLKDGRAYVMGAAQFVLRERFSEFEETIRSFPATSRVLVVAEAPGFTKDGLLAGKAADIEVLGFISIHEKIRASAPQTIAYFAEEGVDIVVISGDDPRTVSHIAKTVGIAHAKDYVDCSALESEQDFDDAVAAYHIFGRVTPAKKRSLVQALKRKGHTVAMTGDGVNDVLALKDADCSIAMAAGAAAARNVSELVLADNDFSHLPSVVVEGRRSINNLTRSACLFLTKTVYSGLLALVCLLLPPYPFIPIQMSLINVSAIGIPSFLLALEVNHERVRGAFLLNVFKRSLPASYAIVLALLVTMLAARVCGIPNNLMSTMCMIEMAVIGLTLIYQISLPLNRLRIIVLGVSFGVCLLGCTVFNDFLRIGVLSPDLALACAVISLAGALFFKWSYRRMSESDALDHVFSRLLEHRVVQMLKERLEGNL